MTTNSTAPTPVDLDALTAALAKATPGRNGCLIWQGGKTASGYGVTMYGGKRITAHRLILGLAIGRMLNKGEFACHHCDNPPCVNPDHLFVGTPKDNYDDMVRKGRADFSKSADQRAKLSVSVKLAIADGRLSVRRGEQNPIGKLSECDVREIRGLDLAQRAIARKFGVAQSLVSQIRSRKAWSHVQ